MSRLYDTLVRDLSGEIILQARIESKRAEALARAQHARRRQGHGAAASAAFNSSGSSSSSVSSIAEDFQNGGAGAAGPCAICGQK